MADDPVARLIGRWHPDAGDLPTPPEENEEESAPTQHTPGDRKTERPGHLGLRRRSHAGHRQ